MNPVTSHPMHPSSSAADAVAIIGIGCRFPGGVRDPVSFWKLLCAGVDAISEVPPERWDADAIHDPEPGRAGTSCTRHAGFIEGVDEFDPQAFGITAREAAEMDPQQRLLLETAVEALEDAGQIVDSAAPANVGVFIGISTNDYAQIQSSPGERSAFGPYSTTGVVPSIAANRISYCLNLTGPSFIVDTACSSSLVAVHLACESLRRGECALALAGGVNALLSPATFLAFSSMGMLSPDGRCKAFDAAANGFVPAEGAGVVLLKPLARALADGDAIYALIRASGVNQDGRTAGLTMPSGAAQAALIRQACRAAGIAPSEVGYVEAHGTGTPVGDPIEAQALGDALGEGRADEHPCVIGSVKTNIGHLEAGAGIAGLIKAALVLRHRTAPPSLHFLTPNPAIDFAALKLRVVQACEPLMGEYAGVNSFGFGGTNAHVLLQTPPPASREIASDPRAHVLPLSACSPEALAQTIAVWRDFLAETPEAFGHICATASLRRRHQEVRAAVVASSNAEAIEKLAAFTGPRAPSGPPRIVFVFSGQGPQWWAMGRGLLREEPVFRAKIEECDALLRALGGWSLLDALLADEAASHLHETAIAQPAIFSLQIALAALWKSWGVLPDAVVGHSVGEVAAAHVAGVFPLPEAMRIIFHRGRCMEFAAARGAMLAAALTPAEAEELLVGNENVSVAAINGPESVTLTGGEHGIAEVERALADRGVFCRRVPVRYAFHSASMDPLREELLGALTGLAPRAAVRPIVSTVTGARASGPEFDAAYWWRNVREPVLFGPAITALINDGCNIFVELSAHPALSHAVVSCLRAGGQDGVVLPSLRRNLDERLTMLETLGRLYSCGVAVSWPALHPGCQPVVRLPVRCWQRERFWKESGEWRDARLSPPRHPLLHRRRRGADPAWETSLDPHLFPWLRDHRVLGRVVFPAAAYVEMMLGVAQEILGDGACTLADFEIPAALFLPEEGGAPLLQVGYRADERLVRIHSRAGEAWTLHATAALRGPAPPAARIDLDEIRARSGKVMTAAEFYPDLAEGGLDFGPAFQNIVNVWQGKGEALAQIAVPAVNRRTRFRVHPALLDACLHALSAALPSDYATDGVLLPVGFRSVSFFGSAGAEAWSHVLLTSVSTREVEADVRVSDAHGRTMIEVRGFRCRAVEGLRSRATADESFYEIQWREQPLNRAASAGGSWLILADRGGLGAALASKLDARGDQCLIAACDAGAETNSRAEMRALLERATPGCGVIHLCALDAIESDPLAAQSLVTHSALHLAQALADLHAGHQLWIVTRGAQPARPVAEPLALAQTPICGLARVIAQEHPGLRCRLVDLDDSPDAVAALIAELSADDAEEEVAWRGGARLVPRLVRGRLPASRRPRRMELRTHPCTLETLRPGVIENLILRERPRRAPGPGEVEIGIVAAGLNFRDVMKALGIYPGGDAVLGDECAGRITALGEGAAGFCPGDEVIAIAAGTLGTHVVVPVAAVVRKPPALSFEEAATIPVAFLTAHHALHSLGRLRAGERVLIHAASGGVGLAAVQLAHAAGATILATAGSEGKRAFLRSLGVAEVMDSRTLAFADEVIERTSGRGVDLVLNSLAGEALERSLSLLAPLGRFLEIGKRDIHANTRLGMRAFQNNIAFFAIDLGQIAGSPDVRELFAALLPQFADGRLRPLPHRTFPLSEAAAAFRHMAQAKHVGKIVITMEERTVAAIPAARRRECVIRPDGTYLITGGLGGFGLVIARWLVERGARHLVLMGRRGATGEAARSAITALEAAGAKVTIAARDVSRAADVAETLALIDRTSAPLRGIFHAAMVLDDGVLTQLDAERFDAVLAPKVAGAWALHCATLGRELDCFVLFSSASSIFGNPGQGNYAAANTFLDALAHHRRAAGLHALVVNWGPLAEVGSAARDANVAAHLERLGWSGLAPSEAAQILERLLANDATQMMAARIEWPRWIAASGRAGTSPRFAELISAPTQRDDPAALRRRVLAEVEGQRAALVETHLRVEIGKALGAAPVALDPLRPLHELGLDSLMAVEVLNRIETQFGVQLPMSRLAGRPTIALLANLLVELLTGQVAAPHAADGNTGHAVDFAAEVRLDPVITADGRTVPEQQFTHPRRVLLTGADTQLGAFLLYELLRQTGAAVICLVENRAAADGAREIMETLARWSLNVDAARIVPLTGDLAQLRLGLDQDAFHALASEVDAIFHAGANVRHLASYEALCPVNVGGLQELLRMAALTRLKPLHYFSAVSVFEPGRGAVVETDALGDPARLPGSYAQSRWVAEKIARLAQARGLPVTIHRPGLPAGDAASGACEGNDLLWRLLKSCITLRSGPDLALPLYLTPVDYMARAAVHLARKPGAAGRVFHLVNPHPHTLAGVLRDARSFGYPIELVASHSWEQRLGREARTGDDSTLLPYLLLYPSDKREELHHSTDLPTFDCRATLAALAGSGITCPPIDAALLALHLRFLIRSGFLPPPPPAVGRGSSEADQLSSESAAKAPDPLLVSVIK